MSDDKNGGRVQVASLGAVALPAQAASTVLRLSLPELAGGATAAAGVADVVALPLLLLSGDTPQPTRHAFGDLNLYVSPDLKSAWFTRDAGAALTLGPVRFSPHEEALNVPARVDGAGVVFDRAALERATGRPAPADLMAQARPQVSESTRASPTGSSALSTRTEAARAAAQNPRQLQNWAAHHLIPFNVANDPAFAPAFLKAAQAGWKLDSPENVIALPADRQSYAGPPNNGVLPQHSGSHPVYDRDVRALLSSALPANGTPAQAKAAVESVEQTVEENLFRQVYDPKLR